MVIFVMLVLTSECFAMDALVGHFKAVSQKESNDLGQIVLIPGKYSFEKEWRGARLKLVIDIEKEETTFIDPERKVFFIAGENTPERSAFDPILSQYLVIKRYESKKAGESEVAGISCEMSEVYSKKRLVFSACLSKEYGFPLRVTEHVPSPHSYEVTGVRKEKIDPSFFEVPQDYRQLSHFPFPIPEWARQVGVAPVVTAPDEKLLAAGQIIKVPLVKGKIIRINGFRQGEGNASYQAVAFKNGEPASDPERNTYSQGARKTFHETPDQADEVVIRVVEGAMRINIELMEKQK